jgi:hypothetical protein
MSEGSAGGLLGTLKTAYDLAKDLMDLRDATVRQGRVVELQKQILAAQESAVAGQIAQASRFSTHATLKQKWLALRHGTQISSATSWISCRRAFSSIR